VVPAAPPAVGIGRVGNHAPKRPRRPRRPWQGASLRASPLDSRDVGREHSLLRGSLESQTYGVLTGPIITVLLVAARILPVVAVTLTAVTLTAVTLT
jgi:hypothetical protein